MKTIVPDLKPKEDINLHAQKDFEKKTMVLGSAILISGHRYFEINTQTMDINEVQYEKSVHFNSSYRRKILVKQRFMYLTALNKKNSLKKYLQHHGKK